MENTNENPQSNNSGMTLNGQACTESQLQEARDNPNVRVAEDKNNPGAYRTLGRIQG